MSVVTARLGGDVHAADDVLSSVFADIVARPESVANVREPGPWLYRVAVNRAADWVRRRRRERGEGEATMSAAMTQVPARELEPIDLLLQRESQHQLVAALASLAAEDAEILTLKYEHGWSYDRIQKYLDLSPGQVANRLRTARLRLKQQLQQSETERASRCVEIEQP